MSIIAKEGKIMQANINGRDCLSAMVFIDEEHNFISITDMSPEAETLKRVLSELAEIRKALEAKP